jgi:regulator of sirC expression with transglutaminase-like and TPR domain
MSELDLNNVKAMISLLDDPDREIYQHISGELILLGKDVVPLLEEAWESAFNPVLQERIENIVHKIQFDNLKVNLRNWAQTGGTDLLTGVLLAARYQYPDLDEDLVRTRLNLLRKDAWVEMHDKMSPHDQVIVLNRVLFDMHGFSGNTSNFHAPQNSFINTVLESRKGNPLLLSIIYILLARQLDIPIYGVNLPEHFVMAYQDIRGNSTLEYTYPEAGIIFYINAFSKGTIFGRSEIDQFLKKLNMESHPTFYEPCSNLDMVRRLIRNLAFSWQKLGEPDKVEEVNQLLECLSPRSLSAPE